MERESTRLNVQEWQPVVIDIRKILEQLGLDKSRCPLEWFQSVEPGQKG